MTITSHPANKNYRDNFDRTFGKKKKPPKAKSERERRDAWACPNCGAHNEGAKSTGAFTDACWKCRNRRP